MSGWNGQFNARLQRLEKMQDSTDGGAVIITDNGTALDKTYAEIYDLIESGTPCYISYTDYKALSGLDEEYAYQVDLFPVVFVYKYADDYRIMAVATGRSAFNNYFNRHPKVSFFYFPSIRSVIL